MKTTKTCPKCAGRDIYVVNHVQQWIVGKGEPIVALDLYVCATCGFAELHAGSALAELERLAAACGMGVHKLAGGATPYR